MKMMMKAKRFFSIILASAMIVATIPEAGLPVYAEETSEAFAETGSDSTEAASSFETVAEEAETANKETELSTEAISEEESSQLTEESTTEEETTSLSATESETETSTTEEVELEAMNTYTVKNVVIEGYDPKLVTVTPRNGGRITAGRSTPTPIKVSIRGRGMYGATVKVLMDGEELPVKFDKSFRNSYSYNLDGQNITGDIEIHVNVFEIEYKLVPDEESLEKGLVLIPATNLGTESLIIKDIGKTLKFYAQVKNSEDTAYMVESLTTDGGHRRLGRNNSGVYTYYFKAGSVAIDEYTGPIPIEVHAEFTEGIKVQVENADTDGAKVIFDNKTDLGEEFVISSREIQRLRFSVEPDEGFMVKNVQVKTVEGFGNESDYEDLALLGRYYTPFLGKSSRTSYFDIKKVIIKVETGEIVRITSASSNEYARIRFTNPNNAKKICQCECRGLYEAAKGARITMRIYPDSAYEVTKVTLNWKEKNSESGEGTSRSEDITSKLNDSLDYDIELTDDVEISIETKDTTEGAEATGGIVRFTGNFEDNADYFEYADCKVEAFDAEGKTIALKRSERRYGDYIIDNRVDKIRVIATQTLTTQMITATDNGKTLLFKEDDEGRRYASFFIKGDELLNQHIIDVNVKLNPIVTVEGDYKLEKDGSYTIKQDSYYTISLSNGLTSLGLNTELTKFTSGYKSAEDTDYVSSESVSLSTSSDMGGKVITLSLVLADQTSPVKTVKFKVASVLKSVAVSGTGVLSNGTIKQPIASVASYKITRIPAGSLDEIQVSSGNSDVKASIENDILTIKTPRYTIGDDDDLVDITIISTVWMKRLVLIWY